jgi:Beta-galactosidase
MKKLTLIFLLLAANHSFSQIKNYLFIGMDRDLLKDTNYFKPALFDGVQIAYSWKQLEPQKDHYDFSIIDEDLAFLKKHGKKLFIQFQDVSFSMKYNHVPEYLLADSIYHGGANKQYRFKDYRELEYEELGWVTRRWDPEVQKRLYKLYAALGKRFDGKVEGINTEETAATFGDNPKFHPPGFSFKGYADAIIKNLGELKKAFPRSTVMVYANFMPGGFLPNQDSVYLKTVYDFARQNKIAVGGPDLLPYSPVQMANSYGFIRNSYKKVPTGVAVQDGTIEYINPHTKQKIKAGEIYQFAESDLHLSYIFWGTEQPFFRSEIVPLLKLGIH